MLDIDTDTREYNFPFKKLLSKLRMISVFFSQWTTNLRPPLYALKRKCVGEQVGQVGICITNSRDKGDKLQDAI